MWHAATGILLTADMTTRTNKVFGIMSYTKWVSCWGNATSITDRREATFAKNLTLRYPMRLVFAGSHLRFRFSNLTGTEPVHLNKASVALVAREGNDARQLGWNPVCITFGGQRDTLIMPGAEVESDAVAFDVCAGDLVVVSMFFADYTQMNSGTLITGPLSKGQYSYGDFADAQELPLDLTRNTNWFYFLNTVDVLTEEKNRAIVCYGDSITAQSWPDYLAMRVWEEGRRDVSIIRRAVSGTRILRQYDCITYQAYGLKGATRFPIEMNVAGASDVIIQHGINDIIHPVGIEVNPFRPWSDMPTLEDLTHGVEELYVQYARSLSLKQPLCSPSLMQPLRSPSLKQSSCSPSLKIWSGTLLPIYGWRTYSEERDELRQDFNAWLRQSPLFDGCIDFDDAVRDEQHPVAFAPGFDSGDHLHPSEVAYKAMADKAFEVLFITK